MLRQKTGVEPLLNRNGREPRETEKPSPMRQGRGAHRKKNPPPDDLRRRNRFFRYAGGRDYSSKGVTITSSTSTVPVPLVMVR